MGHYYSEMKGIDPDQRLEDFLKGHKYSAQFRILDEGGKEITFTTSDLQGILKERTVALQDLDAIKAMFRKLSR